MIYGAKELAESFRTVRRNTIQIAEDIPADKYSFRATPDVMSVGEELAHIACSPLWQQQCHGVDRKTFISFEDFANYTGRAAALERELVSKAQIIDALRVNGEAFAVFLENLSAVQLGERVRFPPPVQPPERTRFEMLLSVKEHEMHHRAKLMVIERLLGIVPHLTRRRMEMPDRAGAAGHTAAPSAADRVAPAGQV
jgi:uncharacterized damage-inducible protein DinB